jgi:hypothetical protein
LSGLASATVANSVFSGNAAGGGGGGLYVERCGLVHITDSAFLNNTAGTANDGSSSSSSGGSGDDGEANGGGGGVGSGSGGGIFAQRCRFDGNRCRGDGSSSGGDGGGSGDDDGGWGYGSCLGSAVAAAEDAILQECDLAAYEVSSALTTSASALVRGQRVALDACTFAAATRTAGASGSSGSSRSSSSSHVTYGVSLALDASSPRAAYALLSRNTPQLAPAGVVADAGAYAVAACGASWLAMNDGDPFFLRAFGVDFAPVPLLWCSRDPPPVLPSPLFCVRSCVGRARAGRQFALLATASTSKILGKEF